MKKIKELKFVQIHPNEQKEIMGGCFDCGCCGMCTCDGFGNKTDDNDRDGGDNGGGGGGTATCGCSGFCMPGDNADGAVQLGTHISQWQ